MEVIKMNKTALSLRETHRKNKELALKLIEMLTPYDLTIKQVKDVLNIVPEVIDEAYPISGLSLAKTSEGEKQ